MSNRPLTKMLRESYAIVGVHPSGHQPPAMFSEARGKQTGQMVGAGQ